MAAACNDGIRLGSRAQPVVFWTDACFFDCLPSGCVLLTGPTWCNNDVHRPTRCRSRARRGGHWRRFASPHSRDLIAIAAAIDRVEALIGAGTAPGPDGSAAAERVADIAFVLHERDVEASLCDALDAAVREICDACALNEAAAQRTHEAAELLHELRKSRQRHDCAVGRGASRAPPAAADAADAALASIEAEPGARDRGPSRLRRSNK